MGSPNVLRQLPVRLKLFWLLFIPATLISLIASGLLLSLRYHDLSEKLTETSTQVAKQVALSSEYAIVFADDVMMSKILQTAFNQTSTSFVQLLDSEQKNLAKLGTRHVNATLDVNQNLSRDHGDFFMVAAPIYYNYNRIDTIFESSETSSNESGPGNILGWVVLESSKAELNLLIWRYFFMLALFELVFILAITLIARRVSNRFAAPISRLDEALQQLIREDYDTAKTISLSKPYEHLQKSLIEIAGRMENHAQELLSGIEQSTEDIQRNMDSLEEKSAQLHIANKEAMESNRLKSEFLANMSHELRTPMSAIQGYTKILKQAETNPQKYQHLDTIESSANNLMSIINDILDFSKIEAEKLTFVLGDFNLRELIDEVYQTLNANLLVNKDKQLDLIPEVHRNIPEWLIGDPERIRQVLINLIGNAVKFTPQGQVKTQVSILQEEGDTIQLSFKVIDTGIGIPQNKQRNLFKPFSQADSSTTRQYGGTGLGLVITKRLIEQMQGNIDFVSTEKVGTTFNFTLQLQKSLKPNTTRQNLQLTTLLYEPSENYKHYITRYLESINIEVHAHDNFDPLINQLTAEGKAIDALLISTSGATLDGIEETKELMEYASQELNIPCILMLQSANQLAMNDHIKTLAEEVLFKPISHDRLYKALEKLSHQTKALPPAAQPTSQLGSLKILVVDDTKINLELVKHWLVPYKIQVSLALSGKQALTLAQEEQFDLIFMDIQMPEMNGMQTTQKIRELPAYINTPIIALTAHASGNEQRQILSSGMNSYLTKPVDEDILLQTIEKWCSPSEGFQGQVQTLVEEIFDLDKALGIVKGNTKLAREMFDMLSSTLEEEHALLKHFYQSGDLEKLIQAVHKIHGAAKYTGAVNLSKHAGYLEAHLKELGFEEVHGVYDDFIETLEALMANQLLIPWPQE